MKNKLNSLNIPLREYRTSKKAYLEVPSNLNEIIIGSMLGDLTAEKPGINSNTRLQFKQSIQNRFSL